MTAAELDNLETAMKRLVRGRYVLGISPRSSIEVRPEQILELCAVYRLYRSQVYRAKGL
jgi:hypothetical protein